MFTLLFIERTERLIHGYFWSFLGKIIWPEKKENNKNFGHFFYFY